MKNSDSYKHQLSIINAPLIQPRKINQSTINWAELCIKIISNINDTKSTVHFSDAIINAFCKLIDSSKMWVDIHNKTQSRTDTKQQQQNNINFILPIIWSNTHNKRKKTPQASIGKIIKLRKIIPHSQDRMKPSYHNKTMKTLTKRQITNRVSHPDKLSKKR